MNRLTRIAVLCVGLGWTGLMLAGFLTEPESNHDLGHALAYGGAYFGAIGIVAFVCTIDT